MRCLYGCQRNVLIMKKKLSLNNLKVKSFVTEIQVAGQLNGGSRTEDLFTKESCYDYVSCARIQCIGRSNADECILRSVAKPYCP